ncbi:penicillin-binding protein 2 [Niabella drilacis]|uniref:Penicillin-binding protein 2 n=1 Tax=Niabella drilacis (strain DSM 25811 / CCM 8410 / CCUG 62505 / LMG 26954 / E90) TaxID=1285928 RepID=A0A1G6ZT06_NIADE|nr:penicillin-binding protein 2 [Niabella drilacis]SDE05651.1 penicillin-binding protein 2 [Niabella drilacis]
MPVFNKSRGYVVKLVILCVFALIVAQLANLQLVNRKYLALAKDNAVFQKVIYPERGIIYDRKGRAVLNNTIMFDLVVTPAEVKHLDTAAFCSLMGIDSAVFRTRIVNAIIKNSRMRPSVFQSLLKPEVQARFEENSWRFPGFALQQRPVRTYPYNVGAHFLGYIGEVDANDMERSGDFYRPGDYMGKNGLEYHYEGVLMGRRGVQYMIKDNKNRLVGHYENGSFDTTAIAGRGLKTSLDVDLQVLAEKLMTNKVGAVVALDPQNGGILAMTSGPVFNPNDLTGAQKNANYAKMALNVRGPLLNRGIKGRYPPGSTFKPLGGLVALSEGVITPASAYPCRGGYYACGRRVGCLESWAGHADNLRLAIAHSCNAFFMNAYRLTVDNPKYGDVKRGYEKWEEYMHRLGLGVRLGVDLPAEDKGKIPTVAVYDEAYNEHWTSCTNLALGMGQDKMLATPLQLANAACIIANRGYYYIPHFVDSIEGETPADAQALHKYRQRQETLTHISAAAYDAIINGMNDVVTQGTAKVAAIPGIDVCAKTGTAENATVLDGKRIELEDNSMFICFAPKDHPRIAIAVVVENAGYGSTWAGPIARILMEQYLLDSLTSKSRADLERISHANLVPWYFDRLQYKTDSVRAEQWTKLTKDSTRLLRFLKHNPHAAAKSPDSARVAIKPVLDPFSRNAGLPGEKHRPVIPEWAVAGFGENRRFFGPVLSGN